MHTRSDPHVLEPLDEGIALQPPRDFSKAFAEQTLDPEMQPEVLIEDEEEAMDVSEDEEEEEVVAPGEGPEEVSNHFESSLKVSFLKKKFVAHNQSGGVNPCLRTRQPTSCCVGYVTTKSGK